MGGVLGIVGHRAKEHRKQENAMIPFFTINDVHNNFSISADDGWAGKCSVM